jgi:outer membrane PBP1 activator LpoA protein
MSGKIVGRMLLVAAVICSLSACTSISLDQPAPVVDSVPAKPVTVAGRKQAPQPQPVEKPVVAEVSAVTLNEPILEAVGVPLVTAGQPPINIALLLPRRSESLAQVSDAVRAGFMAAYQYEPGNIKINLVETGDAAQDVLSGYQNAVLNNDIVIGPLTRSGAAAIVQNRAVTKPTIALTQLNTVGDAEMAVPSNMLVMGLSLEDEARQVADWAGRRPSAKAFVISTSVPWQRRAAGAFAAQWRTHGLQVESMQLSLTGAYLNANALVQLKTRLQSENPALIFVALDAAQTSQLRSAIGNDIDIYGTSQLNPLTLTDWDNAEPLAALEGVRLIDVPWQLQADHTAVMAYPRLQPAAGQRRSADIERLYALGIDAYRVAHNIAINQTDFQIDGVTGKLTVRFGKGPSFFERIEQPAIYSQGKVKALEAQ